MEGAAEVETTSDVDGAEDVSTGTATEDTTDVVVATELEATEVGTAADDDAAREVATDVAADVAATSLVVAPPAPAVYSGTSVGTVVGCSAVSHVAVVGYAELIGAGAVKP